MSWAATAERVLDGGVTRFRVVHRTTAMSNGIAGVSLTKMYLVAVGFQDGVVSVATCHLSDGSPIDLNQRSGPLRVKEYDLSNATATHYFLEEVDRRMATTVLRFSGEGNRVEVPYTEYVAARHS
jgi:hypothetical protein